MALHIFERPLEGPEAGATARAIAPRVGLAEAEVRKVLEQEGFYIRTHAPGPDGVVRLQAEEEVNWIAERLRVKRNRVRAILEAYTDYLRERGLIPQPAA